MTQALSSFFLGFDGCRRRPTTLVRRPGAFTIWEGAYSSMYTSGWSPPDNYTYL